MHDTFTSADAYIRQALALLREEEQARTAAFEREVAELRRKIRGLEALSSSDTIDQEMVFAQRSALPKASDHVSRPGLQDLTAQRWAKRLQGMTQLEALILLAEENDGVIRGTEVKRIFQAAKLTRGNPRHILGHIYQLARNSGQFEKVAPGTFRLLASSQQDEVRTSDTELQAAPALPEETYLGPSRNWQDS